MIGYLAFVTRQKFSKSVQFLAQGCVRFCDARAMTTIHSFQRYFDGLLLPQLLLYSTIEWSVVTKSQSILRLLSSDESLPCRSALRGNALHKLNIGVGNQFLMPMSCCMNPIARSCAFCLFRSIIGSSRPTAGLRSCPMVISWGVYSR